MIRWNIPPDEDIFTFDVTLCDASTNRFLVTIIPGRIGVPIAYFQREQLTDVLAS
jgi:hypothetical protein